LLKGTLAKANALYQSFWTLSHEIPRLLNQSQGSEFKQRYANAHCVGHGLFISIELFEELGGLPEDTLTEDLFLGFKVRASGTSISPVPYLEYADAPSNFRSAFRQKRVWFWGPMLYPYYLLQVLRTGKLSPQDIARASAIALQGWLSSWRWLAAGPVVLFSLAGIVFAASSFGMLVAFLAVAGFALSAPLCVLYAAHFDLRSRDLHYRWSDIAAIALSSIPQIIAHSAAGFLALREGLFWAVTGRLPRKTRTE
ncbi:glycosyltransferase family 2 protein, partial [Rhodovulum sulfidophilum]